MARAKTRPGQTASESSVDNVEIDDIELLNMYRYPEFYSDSENNRVRSSRAAQKRLEELLREMPERKHVRGKSTDRENPEALEYQLQIATTDPSYAGGNSAEDRENPGSSGNLFSSFKSMFQKLLS